MVQPLLKQFSIIAADTQICTLLNYLTLAFGRVDREKARLLKLLSAALIMGLSGSASAGVELKWRGRMPTIELTQNGARLV